MADTKLTSEDLAFTPAWRQAELVRAREVGSRELVELYLERIEAIDPQLNAYRKVMADSALAEAGEIDDRRAPRDERPLLGVPVAVKDNIDVAGELTTNGTRAHGPPAAADAAPVARLRAAGAVILGKVNLPELGIWPFTESLAWGITRNPWNPSRMSGGSSGGSAVAVAAGLAGAALGSDGGGSIRIPAGVCGVFGLKPQRGRVPLAAGTDWWGLGTIGPLTRTVLDSALVYDAICDPAGGRPFAVSAGASPGSLRIAWSLEAPFRWRLDPEVRQAMEDTAALLAGLGHRVERRTMRYGTAGIAFAPRYFAGVAEEAGSLPHPELLEPRTRSMARIGRACRPLVPISLRREAVYTRRLNRVFDHFDVLMTPVFPSAPFEAGRYESLGALRTLVGIGRNWPVCTPQWNMTGQPAAAVPAGFDSGGLPLAVQIVGRPNDEATLLSLAAQLEGERPWSGRRPPV